MCFLVHHFGSSGSRPAAGGASRRLKKRPLSRPNEGLSRLPLILMGISVPPPPCFSKRGSTTLSSLLLNPVVICEMVASMETVPVKSIVSGTEGVGTAQTHKSARYVEGDSLGSSASRQPT